MKKPSGRHYWWQVGNCWLGLGHRVRISFDDRTPKQPAVSTIYPAWGLVCTLLFTLACLAYVGASVGAWVFLRQSRGYTSIAWTDVALPWNWKGMRHKQGLELLAHARHLVEQRKYRESLFPLHAGLGLAPENLAARTTLAQLQALLRREDLAWQTLADGLPYASGNSGYALTTFQTHLAAGNFETILDLAALWFSLTPHDEAEDRRIRLCVVRALCELGRDEEALAALRTQKLEVAPVGYLLRAQMLWQSGKREQATRLLTEGFSRHPTEDALIVRFVDYCRQLGRFHHAELALSSRALAAPDLPGPSLDLLSWLAEQKHAHLERELEGFLRRFCNSGEALTNCAERIAWLGRLDLADRLRACLTPSDKAQPLFELAAIQTLIAAKKPEEALARIEAWRAANLEAHPEKEIDLQIYACLAEFDLPEIGGGRAAFAALLSSRQIGPIGHLRIARHLTQLGHPTEALQAAQRAKDLAPSEPSVLRAVCREFALHGNWEGVAETLESLLSSRHVDHAMLSELAAGLRSDRTVFVPGRTALLARIEAGNRKR